MVIPGRGLRLRARSPMNTGLRERVHELVSIGSGPGPRAVPGLPLKRQWFAPLFSRQGMANQIIG